jgi:hypothetical protein
VDAGPQRLTGAELSTFLESLGLVKTAPVGRSSKGGENATPEQLDELLQRGDPLLPTSGLIAEDAAIVRRLMEQTTTPAAWGLTPDGHLTGHRPFSFDPDVAAEQVVQLLTVDMPAEDRDEALAATWLPLAYHDADHASDFGGVVWGRHGQPGPKACYLDVKGTKARSPGAQRTKLEQRAQERKLGCLAVTVTQAFEGGFAG